MDTNALPLIFFHAPHSRSAGARILFEELQAPHEMRVVNIRTGEQRHHDYLAVNPMGKVPAVLHGDALVTEQVAVYLYLADLFPEAGLAPPIGDPLRGPYLRWMAFYGSSFEPAVVDRAMKHPPVPPSTCPYGDWDTMFKTLVDQLARGPWLLGERFSAADVLWGSALSWTTHFKLVPLEPEIAAYIERFQARPAARKATADDEALAAQMPAGTGTTA